MESSQIVQNGVTHHDNPPTSRLPISRGAQDQGHTRQRECFAGLGARGSGCLTVDESHIHITTCTEREGTNPVFPTSMCGHVCLTGLHLGGALLGSVPRPHRVILCKYQKKHTHITLSLPSYVLWYSQSSKKLGYAWVQKF